MCGACVKIVCMPARGSCVDAARGAGSILCGTKKGASRISQMSMDD